MTDRTKWTAVTVHIKQGQFGRYVRSEEIMLPITKYQYRSIGARLGKGLKQKGQYLDMCNLDDWMRDMGLMK